MKRKKKRSLKNTILNSTAGIMAVLAIIFAFSVDTDSWTPTIVCLACMGFLAVYATVNMDAIEKG